MANSMLKKNTLAFDDPYAMTGGMGTSLPSQSISQPGGSVSAPRVTPYQITGSLPQSLPMSQSQGIGSSLYSGMGGFLPPPVTTVPGQFAGAYATSAPSPYEAAYYQGAQGWEDLRNTLAADVQGLTSPQAWASAGLPGSYWKGQGDKQMGALEQEVSSTRASIEDRFRRKQINAAQRDLEIERLDRQASAQRAQILAGIQSERVNQGMQAANQSAQTLGALYGQVPVASAPQQIALSGLEGLGGMASGGGLSGGNSGGFGDIATQAAQYARNLGYKDINSLASSGRVADIVANAPSKEVGQILNERVMNIGRQQ